MRWITAGLNTDSGVPYMAALPSFKTSTLSAYSRACSGLWVDRAQHLRRGHRITKKSLVRGELTLPALLEQTGLKTAMLYKCLREFRAGKERHYKKVYFCELKYQIWFQSDISNFLTNSDPVDIFMGQNQTPHQRFIENINVFRKKF